MLTDKENLIGNPEDNRESRELGDPRLRFLLEESRKFKGLVHIKSCYNNRYWVRKQSTETGFLDTIAAESEKPEEDQSKPSCTLFKPVYAGNEGHVCELRCLGSENGALFLTLDRGQLSLSKSPTLLFEIVEWDKMVIFPKYVTFKDANGYLSAGNTQGLPHLQFASQDITDPTIGNEVFVNENGTIRIKSTHLGKFWKRSANGILCDAEEKDSFQPDCLFRPVKLGDNTVALCNLGNNQFCKGLTTKGKKNCLNAADLDITKEAHLLVEELVSSRTIYNVEYHVEAAKVDIDRKVIMANYTLENLTPETNWKTVKLGYNDSKTNTWNAPVSLKVSGEMTFKVGVPFIASSEVKISLEVTRSYEWGDSSTPSKYVEVSSTVAVPPMSKRKVMVVASKGKCHVPFSYYQRDLLVNGQYVTVKKHDGLYTGVNYFNFSRKIVVA
ncbi:hypothetical protein Sjap_016039 [Stephania japonica]|uniref:Agglutinin domain-containing protein n=1 Tax=Stephania japonica TaxID=461633 RepID=A0AAP0IM88_9MAGN